MADAILVSSDEDSEVAAGAPAVRPWPRLAKRAACGAALLLAAAAAVVRSGGAGPLFRGSAAPAPASKFEVESAKTPKKECPGAIGIAGVGNVHLVTAKWNKPSDPGGRVEVKGPIFAHMKGRAYFASACNAGADEYSNTDYLALPLMGKRFRYTVDLSGVNCGCNVAVYMVLMQENQKASQCSDFYCDAANVCGVPCAEIDIMEANRFAYGSSLHAWNDQSGQSAGFTRNHRDWKGGDYSPGGRCIDTNRPFQVAASFPISPNNKMDAMHVELSQVGSPCTLNLTVAGYSRGWEITEALSKGVTPVISYWGLNEDMMWLDGMQADGQGCASDNARTCNEAVRLENFAVDVIPR